MKNIYEGLVIDIVEIEVIDVIRTSDESNYDPFKILDDENDVDVKL